MSEERINDILNGLEQIIRRLENLDSGLERTTERVDQAAESLGENAEALDSATMAARAQAQERNRLANAERDARNRAAIEERERQRSLRDAYREGVSSLKSFMGALTSAEAGVTKYSKSVEAGFESLGNLAAAHGGKWGAFLQLGAQGLGALTTSSLKLQDAVMGMYDSFAKMGATTKISTQELFGLGESAGYSRENMAEYAKIVKSVGPNLAALGGSVSDGIKAFGNLTKFNDEQFKKYRTLGLTLDEYNQAQADSIEAFVRQGRILSSSFTSQENLKKASQAYIDNLLVLAEISGTDVETAKKKQEAALAENALQLYLSREEDRRLELLKKEKDLREKAATVTDEETKKRMLQEADATKSEAAKIQRKGQEFENLIVQLGRFMSEDDLTGIKKALGTGTITAESAQIFARMPDEARTLVTSFREGNKSAEELAVEMARAQDDVRKQFDVVSGFSQDTAKFFGNEYKQVEGLREFGSQIANLAEEYKDLNLQESELLKLERQIAEDSIKAKKNITGTEKEQEAARDAQVKELEELRDKATGSERKMLDARIKKVEEFKPDALATATAGREAAEITARQIRTQAEAAISPFLDSTKSASEALNDFAESVKDATKETAGTMDAMDFASAGVQMLAVVGTIYAAVKGLQNLLPAGLGDKISTLFGGGRAGPTPPTPPSGPTPPAPRPAPSPSGALGRAGGLLKGAGVASSVLMVGKDVYDVAASEGPAKNEDIGGIAGGVIGGAIGALGGPIGIAIGASVGNTLGNIVGSYFDEDEKTPEEGEIKEEVPVATPVQPEKTKKDEITAESQFTLSLLEATDALDQFSKMLDSSTRPLESADREMPVAKLEEESNEDSTIMKRMLATGLTTTEKLFPMMGILRSFDSTQVPTSSDQEPKEVSIPEAETEFTTWLVEATDALDAFTRMLDKATSIPNAQIVPATMPSSPTEQRSTETKRLSTMREIQTEREIKNRELELLEQYNNTIESLDLETWNLMETFVDLGKMLTETFGLDFLSSTPSRASGAIQQDNSFFDRLGSLFRGITGQPPAGEKVPPAPTTPLPPGTEGLLEQIARGEGTSDEQAKKKGYASGYDVPLGYGKFGNPDQPLSEMTLEEVKRYQLDLRRNSGRLNSSAVGKYQIVGDTLRELQKELKLPDDTVFDKETQDKMAEALLRRRGIDKLTTGAISEDQFQHNLSKEWASIASPYTGGSYYGQHTGTSDAQAKAAIQGLSKPSAETVQVAQAQEKPTPEPTEAATPVVAQATLASNDQEWDEVRPIERDWDEELFVGEVINTGTSSEPERKTPRLKGAMTFRERAKAFKEKNRNRDRLIRETAEKMGIELGSKYDATVAGSGSQQYVESIEGQTVPLELYSPEQLEAKKIIDNFRAMNGGGGQESLSGGAGSDVLADPTSLIDNNLTNQSYAMDNTPANELVTTLNDIRTIVSRISEQQTPVETLKETIPTPAPITTQQTTPAADNSVKLMGEVLSKMDTLIRVLDDNNSIQSKILRSMA